MPEPGVTPQPTIQRGSGPDALGYGEAAQVNDLVGLVPPPEDQTFTPSTDQENFIFAPSDRPNEAATHGLPFGPGAPTTPHAYESDDQMVQRVAADISQDPNAPAILKQFAARAREGL